MNKQDLTKKVLYDAVKTLVETSDQHIHLNQHKLFTLFSIAFQYILFISTKKPGHYIIRIEDAMLTDKLVRKSKDTTTRKFLQSLILPRKLRYGKSMFHLDFFNMNSWSKTMELPREKVCAALIVKNTVKAPMSTSDLGPDGMPLENSQENSPENSPQAPPQDPQAEIEGIDPITSLQEFVPKTIVIAYEDLLPNTTPLRFGFIQDKDESRPLSGVKIADDFSFDDMD